MNLDLLKSKYQGCSVTDNGFNVWITGSTKKHADSLKADGFRWSPKKSAWWKKSDAAQQALTAAVKAVTPEIIYLPGPKSEPEPVKPVTPAGPVALLEPPKMTGERSFYKDNFEVNAEMARISGYIFREFCNFDRVLNQKFLDFMKSKISEVLPKGYHFYIYYRDFWHKEKNYLHFELTALQTHQRASFDVSAPATSKTHRLTSDEKAEMSGKILSASESFRKKAEAYKNLYWNFADISEAISAHNSMIAKLTREFFEDPAVYQMDYERKYNNAALYRG